MNLQLSIRCCLLLAMELLVCRMSTPTGSSGSPVKIKAQVINIWSAMGGHDNLDVLLTAVQLCRGEERGPLTRQ